MSSVVARRRGAAREQTCRPNPPRPARADGQLAFFQIQILNVIRRMCMTVHIVRFVHPPITRPRSVLALAKITVAFDNHQITLDDLRVVQNRQGELWIAMPSMKDASGSYQPIVEFSPELKR